MSRLTGALKSPPGSGPSRDHVLQRKCACGQHTPGGGECEECRRKRTGTLQRSAIRPSAMEEAPPIVHEVLRSPGHPLDPAARDLLEPHFGQDFSRVRLRTGGLPGPQGRLAVNRPDDSFEQEADRLAERVTQGGDSDETGSRYDFSGVRIHADAAAAESARAVGALAYTAGRDVVFAAGQYAPASAAGRELLAHELTHVVQQGGEGAVLQRKRASSRKEMRDFLTELKEPDFEGDRKSDRKSREIVERSTELGPLSIDDKVRLCKEMIEGITTKREENAILDLLRSTPSSQERQRIATCAGSREEFLSNFSFSRRRAAEAMTLLASDFTPQRESHLVTLPPGRLDEYIAAAMDTDVKARLEKIRLWQKISTPFSLGTKPDAKGTVTTTINDIEVTFLPDAQDSSFSRDDLGGTTVKIDDSQAQVMPDGRVVGFRYVVQTTYGRGSQPNRRAAYGRGATPQDKAAGTTSLRFHEGRHGQAVLDFIRQNPLPNLSQHLGQPDVAQKVGKALCAYTQKLDTYIFTQVDLPKPSIPGGKPPAPRPCP